jgi:hypothetical protein
MAKMQGISLNPAEITGMCGRLRCCLVYEYEQYVEARKQLPRRNKLVGTPEGEGRVIDVLPLLDSVVIRTEDGIRKTVAREDIVPIEEFRKLAEKARQPCDKHGDGACECGKPAGQRQADIVAARQSNRAGNTDTASQEESDTKKPRRRRRSRNRNPKAEGGENKTNQNRRRSNRRGRRRGSNKNKPDEKNKNTDNNNT